MRYEDYFPQADELAEFIFRAVNDDCLIMCQCDYGQSRSAACAAAILEHFEKKGIAVFADDRYLPNQMIFNKLLHALERAHSKPTLAEVFRTVRQDRYYSFIEKSYRYSAEGKTEKALAQLDMLMQIILSDMGGESMYTAYVSDRSADLYNRLKMYNEAEKAYEQAIKLCISDDQNREAFIILKMLRISLQADKSMH